MATGGHAACRWNRQARRQRLVKSPLKLSVRMARLQSAPGALLQLPRYGSVLLIGETLGIELLHPLDHHGGKVLEVIVSHGQVADFLESSDLDRQGGQIILVEEKLLDLRAASDGG